MLAFKGQRISLVYFTVKSYANITPSLAKCCSKLGFTEPTAKSLALARQLVN